MIIVEFINSHINIITIILLIVTAGIGFINLLIYIKMIKRPKIKVYFPNRKKDPLQFKSGTRNSIPICVENIRKKTIHKGDIGVYMSKEFTDMKLKFLKKEITSVQTVTTQGIFGDNIVQYLYTGDEFVLKHSEWGLVELETKMPDKQGLYLLKVYLSSNQGDSDIHELAVTII